MIMEASYMQIKLFKAVLNLFEASAGASGTAGGEGTASTGGTNNQAVDAGQSSKKGDLAKVVYGKQDGATPKPSENTTAKQEAATPTKQSQEDRIRAYNAFKAENKDLYEADFQRVFDKRFKNHKELENTNAAQRDVIDRMMVRYGITDGKLESLNKALDNDDAYYEAAADRQGMTVEQYKMFEELRRNNAILTRNQQEMIAEQEKAVAEARKEAQLQKWAQEAATVQQQYPAFSLEAELQNDRFGAMLKSGTPMLDAYRAMHFDELQNQTIQQTATQTEQAVTANIRAKGSRPVENGTVSQSSFVVKDDVHKLTKQDRAEIAKRSLRGEIITF